MCVCLSRKAVVGLNVWNFSRTRVPVHTGVTQDVHNAVHRDVHSVPHFYNRQLAITYP